MKILQVNVVYKFGSTGKIVYDIHKILLKQKVESIVCYGRGKKIYEPNVYKLAPEILMKIQSLYSKITGYQYKWCFWSTKKAIKIIKKNKPDIVHLQCINANTVDVYKILNYLKKNNIPTLLTLHAEFMYTGGCAHAFDCELWKTGCNNCPQSVDKSVSFFFDRSREQWNLLKKSYHNFDNLVITCVSGWLKKRAEQSPFFKNNRIEVVNNGLDTSIFYPISSEELKIKHNLNGEKIVLHVTPNFNQPLKGGKYVIELAKRLINNSSIKFIIIGYKGNGSDLPENVIPISFTKNQVELAKYYSLADVTLLTSSRETFSMVCAESLCCGTPVVGFKAGGPETISLKNYSTFVNYGDIDNLEKNLLKWLEFKKNSDNRIALEAKSIYSKENMVNKYLNIYKSMIN